MLPQYFEERAGLHRALSLASGRTRCGFHPLTTFFLALHSAERAGFEPAVQLPVRQFSKLVVSATHPSLLGSKN